ncbi:hypothetical protein F5B17DRAFT_271052 [Nemania serpens]|nr:hypothetical protein F5B17DRAFT_271052 [Nemania serpens]
MPSQTLLFRAWSQHILFLPPRTVTSTILHQPQLITLLVLLARFYGFTSSSPFFGHQPVVFKASLIMCNFTKNYYIYTSCQDPGAHFFRTSIDGSRQTACPRGPHERYIVEPGQCPLCS